MAAPLLPTVTGLLTPLVDVDDRGVHAIDTADSTVSFVSWRKHIQDGANLAALLRARLDPGRPPHVGVLAGNTPFFCTVLVAAALSGIVPVGLNPTRRGAALVRDIEHADCQLVLADDPEAVDHPVTASGSAPVLDTESRQFADELSGFTQTPVEFRGADPDDLFMLIFTSGTSGDPKAVRCTHEKVAFPGAMLAQRLNRRGLAATVVLRQRHKHPPHR
ncbi:MAG: AMP-binding protein, partial [Mycobacterium sp.]